MDHRPQIAAVMAAVNAYIRDQEAVAVNQNAPVSIPADMHRQLYALHLQLSQLFGQTDTSA